MISVAIAVTSHGLLLPSMLKLDDLDDVRNGQKKVEAWALRTHAIWAKMTSQKSQNHGAVQLVTGNMGASDFSCSCHALEKIEETDQKKQAAFQLCHSESSLKPQECFAFLEPLMEEFGAILL